MGGSKSLIVSLSLSLTSSQRINASDVHGLFSFKCTRSTSARCSKNSSASVFPLILDRLTNVVTEISDHCSRGRIHRSERQKRTKTKEQSVFGQKKQPERERSDILYLGFVSRCLLWNCFIWPRTSLSRRSRSRSLNCWTISSWRERKEMDQEKENGALLVRDSAVDEISFVLRSLDLWITQVDWRETLQLKENWRNTPCLDQRRDEIERCTSTRSITHETLPISNFPYLKSNDYWMKLFEGKLESFFIFCFVFFWRKLEDNRWCTWRHRERRQ